MVSTSGVMPMKSLAIEEHWVTLPGGARTRYLRAGSGPPLVLVHGLLGYSFSWRFTIPALSQQSTVYALDMPGTGYSVLSLGQDCSLQASAGRLLHFMDKTNIASCDLLGTSHGGAVAMTAVALAPGRIRRLILVDPVNPWSHHGKHLTKFLSNRLITPLFLSLAYRVRLFDEFYLRRLFGDPRRIPPDSLEGYRKPLCPDSFKYGIAVARSWNRDLKELEVMLPRIAHIPTLLLWGSRDAAVDPASAARLKQHFTNCRLVMFDGVGHLPYEEVPEDFNRAVARFQAGE